MDNKKSFNPKKSSSAKPNFNKKKSFSKKPTSTGSKSFKPKFDSAKKADFTKDEESLKPKFDRGNKKPFTDRSKETAKKPSSGGSFKPRFADKASKPKFNVPKKASEIAGEIRLNRFIATSGICSRREADNLISNGLISINGTIVTTLGTKVKPGDDVRYAGDKLHFEKLVYVLMNKPKGFITTAVDPHGRKTVMDLLGPDIKERLYPVGRLDRNTTGLLILTNDGTLTKKLTHPKHGVKKIYHVETDKTVTKKHLETLVTGITLEDGPVKADVAAYVDGSDKKRIGIELHSGKNRVIRRMLEHLGYTVEKLDRIAFAGLTKKDIPRGKWRFLTEKEVGMLNMIS